MRLYGRNLETVFKIFGALAVFSLIFFITISPSGNFHATPANSQSLHKELENVKRRDGVINEDRIGRPVSGRNFIIFYNAIPKTGSRSLDNAMIHVAKKWPNLISFRLIPPAAFGDAERLDTFLSHRKIPSFVRGHAMYTECKGGPEIVYINIVRDPVERVISNYYFDLFGDTAAKNASHGEDNWPETIDECLKMTSHRCNDAITYYTEVTLRQFCGMDERCKIVNEWTLSRAKRNLQQYTIVGLSSEIDTTIKALQILLPDMFKDVDLHDLYSRHQNDSIAYTKTNVKHSPRPETIKLLRERMDLQYEFFDYVMTRYSKLKRDLRID